MTIGDGAAAGPARDPGLQPERTSLAWGRSVLGGSATTALIAVTADRAGHVAVVVATATVAVVLAVAVLRYATRPAHRRTDPWPPLLLAGGSVVALAALGLATAAATLLERLP